MGNITSDMSEEYNAIQTLHTELKQMRLEMSSFQKRLAGLEKDVSNFGVILNKAHDTSQENSNALLNLSLLEEGRSFYRKPKRHTGSSFN